jgi:aminopeptidase N
MSAVEGVLYLTEWQHLRLPFNQERECHPVEQRNVILPLNAFDDPYRGIGTAAADLSNGFVGHEDDKLAEQKSGPALHRLAMGLPLDVKLIELFLDFLFFTLVKGPAGLIDPYTRVRGKVCRYPRFPVLYLHAAKLRVFLPPGGEEKSTGIGYLSRVKQNIYLAVFLLGGPVAASLFLSCHSSRKAARQEVLLDTVTISANDPYHIYRESAPRLWNIVHTDVALRFDLNAKTAEGLAKLQLHPYAYPADSLALDAKNLKLDEKVQYDGPGALKHQAVRGDSIILYFDRALRPKDTIGLTFRYTATPYHEERGGGAAIRDRRGLYFINTDGKVAGKPSQIWTQGETEANSHWVPTIDRPNSRSSFRIALTVADSFRTLSNGALVESRVEGNMRTDIWEIKERIPVYTAMFAIGKFAVITDEWQGREVSYYVEPEFAPYARLMFRNTPEMMDFFSQVTGVPYPWNKYSQVVVRDYVSGAMENTSASLFGEFMNQNARELMDDGYEFIVAHELFHQWFGDYVTAESWSHLTLNESFANYGEYLWWRYKYGTAAADEYHFNDLAKYLGSTEYGDPELVRFHYHDHDDMFDRVSYQKGGRILYYLHQLTGDSAFFRAMQLYLTRHALRPAEAADWRLAVEEATGLDWNWFFNQWYYRGGHPVLDVQYQYDDAAQRLNVTLTQQQSGDFVYRLPLKTAVIYGDAPEIVDWDIRNRKHTFSYPYKNGQKPVLTPDITHCLPGEIHESKLPAEWLTQYTVCGDYFSKRRALAQVYGQFNDSSAKALFRLALKDTMASIRIYALNRLKEQKKGREEWQQQVASLSVFDGNNKVRAAAFDVLGAWRVSGSAADMTFALDDSSYHVAGAALAALYALQPDTAYAQALRLWQTAPRGRLQQEIWTILGKHGKDADVLLFAQDARGLGGARKIQLGDGLTALLKRTQDDGLFSKGLSILEEMTLTENISGYRRGLGGLVFELGKSYNARTKSDKGAEVRLQQISASAARMTDSEKDPGVKKQFEEWRKAW